MTDNCVEAAFRDASWLNNPDVRTPKNAHILKSDGKPACGLKAVMCDPFLRNRSPPGNGAVGQVAAPLGH